jgi:hypothetical protein
MGYQRPVPRRGPRDNSRGELESVVPRRPSQDTGGVDRLRIELWSISVTKSPFPPKPLLIGYSNSLQSWTTIGLVFRFAIRSQLMNNDWIRLKMNKYASQTSTDCCLAGLLACWLAGWLTGWLAGWLIDWLAGLLLAGLLAGWLAGWG